MNPFIPQRLPLDSLDWARFIRPIGQAHAALARYDGILQGIVNPQVLLSPLTTQEAVLSSRIEGTQTSLEEVLEYEANETAAPDRSADILEVLNYDRLLGITDASQWNEWIAFFLAAIAEQARENSDKARAILGLYERMKVQLPGIVATQFSVRALDTLFDRPIFRTTDFVERSKIPKATANRILRALTDHRVLRTLRAGGGRRPAVLVFQQLIEITESNPFVGH